jgi:Flp pilus assembly protein TadD
MSSFSRTWWIYVFLTTITLPPFVQVLGHDFVNLDDDAMVTANPWVQKGLTKEGFWQAFGSHHGAWYPLTLISYQLDASLFGPTKAWGFHLTNLLLHLANVLLVFGILNRLTGSNYRSALVAGLFAIHPMRAESVAWVTERKDVLFLFFWLLGLASYLYYTAKPGWWRYLLVLGMLGLSLMAKPMGVTFGCVMLLLDFWPLNRLRMGPPNQVEKPTFSWPWLVLEKVPFLLVSALVIVLMVRFHHAHPSVILPPSSLASRLAQVPVIYTWYVLNTFWPFSLGLYPNFPVAPVTGTLVGSLLFLGAISWFAWRWRHREPAVLLGWLWFLGTLVPVVGVVQAPVPLADRFTYLPHIGLFLALVWGLARFVSSVNVPIRLKISLGGGMGALVLVVLLWTTWLQTSYWKNSLLLWQRTARINGESFQVHEHLGHYHMIQGEHERAAYHFQRCLDMGYLQPSIYQSLGWVLYQNKDWPRAERCLLQWLAREPANHQAHGLLGQVYFQQQKYAQAVLHLEKFLRIQPQAEVFQALGMCLLELDQPQRVVAEMNRALGIAPNFAQGYLLQGRALLELNRSGEACSSFRQALHYQPDLAEAYAYLGLALGRLQQWEEAEVATGRALTLATDAELRQQLQERLRQWQKNRPQGQDPSK